MTTDQFRNCFVGERGFESLKKLMKNGYDLTTELSKCFQERCDIEYSYAKSLRKNSETMQKLANRAVGSLVQALTQISTQTNIESEVHQSFGNEIQNKISVPMKNLAETQLKAKKPTEDMTSASLKAWEGKRSSEKKYRLKHFENCREIENLYLKMDEIPKTPKNVAKETLKIETSLRKLETELEKYEKKYHEATKEVEATRQAFDIEMCRGCDLMQTMEINRICEMQKFIQTYVESMQTLAKTMNDVQQDLLLIRITPDNDIVTEGKMNIQTTETEILLYDILAETEPSVMSTERRLISLRNWIQMLKQDIDIQRRSKDDVPVMVNLNRAGSSSSDEDGAMNHHHRKREGMQNLQGFCQQNQNFQATVNANDIYTNQQQVRLFQCLYEGSLYKMEKVYNRLKNLPEPTYQYSENFAKTAIEKNTPISYLRIPFEPLTKVSPQAPSPMMHLARSTPIMTMENKQSNISSAAAPPPYSVTTSHSTIGWAVNDMTSSYNQSDNQPVASCPYPIPQAAPMHESPRSTNTSRVQVLHSYDAEHDDELTIQPGDIIVLLERRSDGWYKGRLNHKVGLFPGNFSQDI